MKVRSCRKRLVPATWRKAKVPLLGSSSGAREFPGWWQGDMRFCSCCGRGSCGRPLCLGFDLDPWATQGDFHTLHPCGITPLRGAQGPAPATDEKTEARRLSDRPRSLGRSNSGEGPQPSVLAPGLGGDLAWPSGGRRLRLPGRPGAAAWPPGLKAVGRGRGPDPQKAVSRGWNGSRVVLTLLQALRLGCPSSSPAGAAPREGPTAQAEAGAASIGGRSPGAGGGAARRRVTRD